MAPVAKGARPQALRTRPSAAHARRASHRRYPQSIVVRAVGDRPGVALGLDQDTIRRIEHEFDELCDALKPTVPRVDDARYFVTYGEYAVAFNVLVDRCTNDPV